MKQPSLTPAIVLTIAAATCAQGAIIATEVGNNAPGSDDVNEYVVLLNTGATSVNVSGFDITDDTLSWSAISSLIIGAGQSLVISSGADILSLETAWGSTIPGAAQFVVVSGLAGFNNTLTDSVQLRDASDTTIYSFSFDSTLGDDDPPTSIALGASGGSGGTSATPFSTVSTIPEPAAALLGALGLLGILRRRR